MSDKAPMSYADANAVYDILVEHAGEVVDEYSRQRFVDAQMAYVEREYRFMGALGFGGKFRRRYDDVWFVACYPEDMNPHRQAVIDATNAALDAYRAKHA